MKQNARGLGAVVHNVARPLSQVSHLVSLSGLPRERKKSAQASPPLFFNGVGYAGLPFSLAQNEGTERQAAHP